MGPMPNLPHTTLYALVSVVAAFAGLVVLLALGTIDRQWGESMLAALIGFVVGLPVNLPASPPAAAGAPPAPGAPPAAPTV